MTSAFIPVVANSETKVFQLSVTRVRDFAADGELVNEKFTVCSGNKLLAENLNWFEIDDVFIAEVTKESHATD